MFTAKQFAGTHCGCRYQQDYRPTLGKDGKKESGTLEVIKFYYDGAIRMEQHCYGEAATFVFGVWAEGMDADGTLHWALPAYIPFDGIVISYHSLVCQWEYSNFVIQSHFRPFPVSFPSNTFHFG